MFYLKSVFLFLPRKCRSVFTFYPYVLFSIIIFSFQSEVSSTDILELQTCDAENEIIHDFITGVWLVTIILAFVLVVFCLFFKPKTVRLDIDHQVSKVRSDSTVGKLALDTSFE